MKRKESILLRSRICGKSDVTGVVANNECRRARQPTAQLHWKPRERTTTQRRRTDAICVGRLKIAVAKGTKRRQSVSSNGRHGQVFNVA